MASSINNISNPLSSTAVTVDPGASGDSTVSLLINTVAKFTIGSDDDASDAFKISASSALGTTDTFVMTTAGECTKPLQPSFFAFLGTTDSNVTGGGTEATLTGLTEEFDQNNDFSSSTFTAPVAGIYVIRSVMRMSISESYTSGFTSIKTTGQVFKGDFCSPGAIQSGFNQKSCMIMAFVDLAASDTVTTTVTYSGASDTSDIQGAGNVTNFSIMKVA